ncbi:MAG TPA: hypothetical protein VFB99_14515, partial [Vicinamibacterales bacterium]|nr:hypothetical protein [Vicinamibacterales bacterium]
MRMRLWVVTGVIAAVVAVSFFSLRNDAERPPAATMAPAVVSGATTDVSLDAPGNTSAIDEEAPVPIDVAGGPVNEAAPTWDTRYREATDYFAFVEAAAPAAMA